ncbi:hypothetical protein [Phormidesmis priestleyi]
MYQVAFGKLYRSDFWVGGFGGLIEAIDDLANFTGCESSFVGFGVEGDKQNADFVFQLVNDSIARTFAFLNVAVFDSNFENVVGRASKLIAKIVATFEVIKQRL